MPKYYGSSKYGVDQGLRPNTKLERWPIYFIFNEGGMGDLVNYTGATTWLEEHAPWVDGRIFAPRYLCELLSDIHKRFKVFASEEINSVIEDDVTMVGPSLYVKGVNRSPQLLTCLGAHPFDIGFAYFASTTPPPAGAELPVLDYPRLDIVGKNKYAVICTGGTTHNRSVSGRHLNPIISYVRQKGLMPVFLGKKALVGYGPETTMFADDVDMTNGLDLRDQTSVKQAAAIMQHAEFTLGLDGGLLHLAALMKDSKIIFGYNITTIAHREPRRSHGKTINITLDDSTLKCIGCQSKLKNIAKHKFDQCLYGDNKCVELMFGRDAELWLTAIDEVLDGR